MDGVSVIETCCGFCLWLLNFDCRAERIPGDVLTRTARGIFFYSFLVLFCVFVCTVILWAVSKLETVFSELVTSRR